MAVEAKTINTRLVLRNDTLANWEGSDKVLLKGEAALAFDGSVVKMLVGDGEKKWSELSGDASTIGNIRWKTGNIIGLQDYISSEETNTTYKLVEDSLSTGETGKSYKLQKQEKGESTWTDVEGSRFNIPQFDPSTLRNEIDTISVQVSSFTNEWKSGIDTWKESANTEIYTNIPQDIEDLCVSLSNTITADYVKYTDVNGGREAITEGNKIATLKDVVGLSGSVYILGTIANEESESGKTDQTVIVETYPNAKRGAIVLNTTNGKEYICMAEIGATASATDWKEIGDEKIYATKAELKLSVETLETSIGDEKTRAEGIEGGIRTDIDTLSVKYDTFVGTTYENDKTAISAYINEISAALSGDYYAQIQEEKTRAEGIEGGLRSNLDTVSVDLDDLEGKALTSVVINDITADITTTANVAQFNISCIDCGNANTL